MPVINSQGERWGALLFDPDSTVENPTGFSVLAFKNY